MTALLAAAASVAVAASTLLCAMDSLNMLQLESYQLPGYFRWMRSNLSRAILAPGLCSAFSLLMLAALRLWLPEYAAPLASAAALAGGIAVYWMGRRRPAKKPLVITRRVGRLMVVTLLLTLVAGLIWLAPHVGFAALLLPALAPLVLALAALAAAPMEKAINRWYFRDAQRMLRGNPNLIRIGVTGSYGKTSTKFILGTLLAEKYRVLVTPSSFNTPMGVTRVVREQLKSEDEVFIAEMGARHVGDIRELCELVAPTIGVLTSVGRQHLETFGSIENVASTKYELIEALPKEGAAFFAADGGWCEVLYNQTGGNKFLAGLKESCPVYAKDISVSPQGSAFTLVTPQGEIACITPLLGRHNIQNTVLCAAVALYLGLSPEELARGMGKLTPVEHRLQLIAGAGGVTVIDDAFNANPEGAKAAMEVLASFPGRRIVVTPGMVELGGEEEALNRAFGRQMAAACDVALLIGKRRSRPIKEGLLEKGFDPANIKVLDSLDAASGFLAREGKAGDVVLFENDLPDNYSE